MRRALDRIAALRMDEDPGSAPHGLGVAVPWHQVTYEVAAGIRLKIVSQWPGLSMANLHLSALRGVCKEAWKLGLMDGGEYERVRAIENVTGRREPAGRSIHRD